MLELLNGAQILSDTWATGDAGSIIIHAGEMTVDGQGSGSFTGISSDAEPGSTGSNAGSVDIDVKGLLEVLNGAQISSSTFATSHAGTVNVHAGI